MKRLERFAHRRFLFLLISLIAMVITYPILHESDSTRFLYVAFATVIFVAAIRSVSKSRWQVIATILLGVPSFAALLSGYAVGFRPGPESVAAIHVFGAAFHAFLVTVIVRIVHQQSSVTADGIYGAFCAYLLIGLGFAHLYCLADVLQPGSFKPDFENRDISPHLQHYSLTYFSFITLTTVGYGDIVPVRGCARSLALAEALIGQFYVAAFVGELIGKRVAQMLANLPSESIPKDEPET